MGLDEICQVCKKSNWSEWRIKNFKALGGPARVRDCLTEGCGNGQLSGRIRDPGFKASVEQVFKKMQGDET